MSILIPYQPITWNLNDECQCPGGYCQPVREDDHITVQFNPPVIGELRGEVIDRNGDKVADIPSEWFVEMPSGQFKLEFAISDVDGWEEIDCPFTINVLHDSPAHDDCDFCLGGAGWDEEGDAECRSWALLGDPSCRAIMSVVDEPCMKSLYNDDLTLEPGTDYKYFLGIINASCVNVILEVQGDNPRLLHEQAYPAEENFTISGSFTAEAGDTRVILHLEALEYCDADILLILDTFCVAKVVRERSNCFTIDHPESCKVLLQATNPRSAFGFDFANDWQFQLRIDAILRRVSYPEDRILWQDSKGVHGLQYDKFTRQYEIAIQGAPEWVHDCIRMMLGCDDFRINGRRVYKLEGTYSPDYNRRNEVMPSTFQVVEDTDMRNSPCLTQSPGSQVDPDPLPTLSPRLIEYNLDFQDTDPIIIKAPVSMRIDEIEVEPGTVVTFDPAFPDGSTLLKYDSLKISVDVPGMVRLLGKEVT